LKVSFKWLTFQTKISISGKVFAAFQGIFSTVVGDYINIMESDFIYHIYSQQAFFKLQVYNIKQRDAFNWQFLFFKCKCVSAVLKMCEIKKLNRKSSSFY